jgi:hypothetical protein
MELLVLDFGDSYDRFVVGVARDLAEARVMARAYVEESCYDRRVMETEYFGVQRQVVGVPRHAMGDDYAVLDLVEPEEG